MSGKIFQSLLTSRVRLRCRSRVRGVTGGARKALFQAMNEWFAEFIRTNPAVRPPPPHDHQTTPVAPLVTGTVIREKPPVDKIKKQGAEEFRATKDDDTEKAEFWLENTISIFDELCCTPENV